MPTASSSDLTTVKRYDGDSDNDNNKSDKSDVVVLAPFLLKDDLQQPTTNHQLSSIVDSGSASSKLPNNHFSDGSASEVTRLPPISSLIFNSS